MPSLSTPQAPSSARNVSASSTDGVSRKALLAYGAGGAAVGLTDFAYSHLASPVFTSILGVNPALVGTLQTVGALWNGFTQPLMGAITDNHRSPQGRRRPFILWGGLLTAAAFALVFFPPRGWSPTEYFIYLTATSFVFYTASTVLAVPYNSLLPELSPSTQGRNQLAAVMTLFMRSVLFMMVWLFWLTQRPFFSDSIAGVRAAGVCVAVVAIGMVLWTYFGLREPHQARIQKQEKFSIIQGIRETMGLKPLYSLVAADLLIGIAGNLVNTVGFFLIVYYMHRGDLAASSITNGIIGTVFIATSLLAVTPATMLAQKFGRVKVFYGCVAAIICGSVLKWFCLRDGDATWAWLPFALVGPGQCIAPMILTAMRADVTDWDELQNGKRREGMIGAVQTWIYKTTNAFNAGLAGLLLLLVSFDVSLGAAQAPGTFYWLRLLFSGVPIMFALLAVLAIRRFPFDEKAAAEMRLELERRRGE